MNLDIDVVILCGGNGQRLWPSVNKDVPKYKFCVNGRGNLLTHVLGLFKKTNSISIMANEKQIKGKEYTDILGTPRVSLCAEPFVGGTAVSIAMSALMYKHSDQQATPERPMLISPVDYIIDNKASLLKTISLGMDYLKEGDIVFFGEKPPKNNKNTQFGYLGRKGNNRTDLNYFIQKPDINAVNEMVFSKKDVLWNTGLMLALPSTIIKMFEENAPDILKTAKQALGFKEGEKIVQPSGYIKLGGNYYDGTPSFENLFERVFRGTVLELDCGWHDIGNWKSVHEYSDKDENGCCSHANSNATIRKCKNVLVHNSLDTPLKCIGLENVAVILNEEGLLVINLENASDVKAP